MMCDDLDPGMPLEDAVEHEPPHRDARLVRPSECPPQLVFGSCFRLVVRKLRAARRMQEKRQIALRHGGEERRELGRIERFARDIGKYLNTPRTERPDATPELGEGSFGM